MTFITQIHSKSAAHTACYNIKNHFFQLLYNYYYSLRVTKTSTSMLRKWLYKRNNIMLNSSGLIQLLIYL